MHQEIHHFRIAAKHIQHHKKQCGRNQPPTPEYGQKNRRQQKQQQKKIFLLCQPSPELRGPQQRRERHFQHIASQRGILRFVSIATGKARNDPLRHQQEISECDSSGEYIFPPLPPLRQHHAETPTDPEDRNRLLYGQRKKKNGKCPPGVSASAKTIEKQQQRNKKTDDMSAVHAAQI